jgi:SET domain-containing protein
MPATKKKSKTVAKKSATAKRHSRRAPEPLFEVRKSAIQGRGGFAVRPIRKGQRIVEYQGERVSNEEADARYDETKMGRHHTFLFTLDDDTVVDGAVKGNEAIYINHSCAPNCEAIISGKRIWIHALRAIQPGEELVYDYQYERTGENDEELEKFYECRCGAPTCRGSIMKPAKPKKRARKPATRGTKAKTSAGNSRRKTRVK